MVAKEEAGWQREGLECGSRWQLLYVGWINNKVLPYSTGDSIQYSVINHNVKEYEKEYICKTDLLCCVTEINTSLRINYKSIKFFFNNLRNSI